MPPHPPCPAHSHSSQPACLQCPRTHPVLRTPTAASLPASLPACSAPAPRCHTCCTWALAALMAPARACCCSSTCAVRGLTRGSTARSWLQGGVGPCWAARQAPGACVVCCRGSDSIRCRPPPSVKGMWEGIIRKGEERKGKERKGCVVHLQPHFSLQWGPGESMSFTSGPSLAACRQSSDNERSALALALEGGTESGTRVSKPRSCRQAA